MPAEKKEPTHGVEPESQEIKLQLRQDAVQHLSKHGTIVDLFAGEGIVSEIYKPHAERLILVDDDKRKLGSAKRRLQNGSVEYFNMDNFKFMEEILPSIRNLTLVDFDPYGSVGKHLQAFFNAYPVKHQFILCLTDGATKDIRGIMQDDAWREHYLSDRKEVGKYDWPDLIEALLRKLGSTHGFEIRQINGGWNSDYGAWYASYLIQPKGVGKAELQDLPGLYLVEPHSYWIWNGEKTAIVKSVKFQAHINEPLYLLGEYVYGIIKLHEPREISLKQFEDLRDRHRISESERKRWWPDKTQLYLYEFDLVEKFKQPKEYEFQPGTQIFVSHVVFKAREGGVNLTFLGTLGEIEETSEGHRRDSSLLASVDSVKLLIDFGEDHKGTLGRIKPDWILLTHLHPDHAFGLKDGEVQCPVYMSEESSKLLKDAGLLNISDRRTFKDFEGFTVGPFTVTPIPVTHSTKAPAHGFRIELNDHMIAYFPDVLEISRPEEAFRDVGLYIGDGSAVTRDIRRFSEGEPIGHASMMKQTKMAREFGVKEIYFTHLGSQPLSEGKDLSEIVENFGAKVAYDGLTLHLKGDRIEVEKAYLSRCKPAYRIFDLSDLEEIKAFQDPDQEIVAEVKWDGERIQIEKAGTESRFYSDMPRDISKRLPTQVKEISGMEGSFTLDSEAVMLDVEEKEALHRSMVVAFLNAKTDPEPACDMLHLMVFDVLKLGDRDLRDEPLSERLKILSKFKDTDHIHFMIPERDLGKKALGYVVKRNSSDFPKIVENLMTH